MIGKHLTQLTPKQTYQNNKRAQRHKFKRKHPLHALFCERFVFVYMETIAREPVRLFGMTEIYTIGHFSKIHFFDSFLKALVKRLLIVE